MEQVNIYTFYDNIDIGLLMGYHFEWKQLDILLSSSNATPSSWFHPALAIAQDPLSATRPLVGKCWVFMEGRPPHIRSRLPFPKLRDIQEVLDPLLKKLLEEPDSLKEYNMEVIESHVLVLCQCLWIIRQLHLLSNRE